MIIYANQRDFWIQFSLFPFDLWSDNLLKDSLTCQGQQDARLAHTGMEGTYKYLSFCWNLAFKSRVLKNEDVAQVACYFAADWWVCVWALGFSMAENHILLTIFSDKGQRYQLAKYTALNQEHTLRNFK